MLCQKCKQIIVLSDFLWDGSRDFAKVGPGQEYTVDYVAKGTCACPKAYEVHLSTTFEK